MLVLSKPERLRHKPCNPHMAEHRQNRVLSCAHVFRAHFVGGNAVLAPFARRKASGVVALAALLAFVGMGTPLRANSPDSPDAGSALIVASELSASADTG